MENERLDGNRMDGGMNQESVDWCVDKCMRINEWVIDWLKNEWLNDNKWMDKW